MVLKYLKTLGLDVINLEVNHFYTLKDSNNG